MGGSSVPQASWILLHIEYFGWQAFVTVLLLPRGNVPWAKLKNIILLFKAARSLMQIFLYFSTLEIHSGSTMCEMSVSWIRCHRSRVFASKERPLIRSNCDVTCSSLLFQVSVFSHPWGLREQIPGTSLWNRSVVRSLSWLKWQNGSPGKRGDRCLIPSRTDPSP